MTEPHAINIFHFDSEKKLILNDNIFKILKHKKVKDKKVCVISIAGAFRQGKSLMQNFLIRYLEVKYKLKRCMIDWLDSKDGPISGFSWQAGSKPHTFGILMWSEIFLAELPSKEEVAIIIMDTQGSFDNMTTVKESAIIFALSILISSVQIYNLKENIKQYDLQHLEFFSGYGQMVVDNSADVLSKTTFQKLIFLIRDWPYSFEKEYGLTGGEHLLKEVLNTEENHEELISLKNNIREIFTEINCCLLPYPGDEVACSVSFQGDIDAINSDFKKEVQTFIDIVLAPENLTIKNVSGQILKTENLVDLIKTYWKCFADGNIPPLKSLLEATIEIQHQSAMEEAEEMYKRLMINCREQKKATKIMSNVLNAFRMKKKMGSALVKEQYEKQFIINLDELYSKNYKTIIDEYENSLSTRAVSVGSTTGTIGGTTMAATMAITGIAVSASAGEIALVVAVTAAGAAASGFIIGAAVIVAAEGIRWSVNKIRKIKRNNEDSNIEEISDEMGSLKCEIICNENTGQIDNYEESNGSNRQNAKNEGIRHSANTVIKRDNNTGNTESYNIGSLSNQTQNSSCKIICNENNGQKGKDEDGKNPSNKQNAKCQVELKGRVDFSFNFTNWFLVTVAIMILIASWIVEWL